MNPVYCPNCRWPSYSAHAPCRSCGWLPLQSTEMVFLDDQQIVCPKCSTRRAPSTERCPRCGEATVLEGLTSNVANFRISSLFLLTTLAALCLAVGRVSPAIAVLLAAWMTAALIRAVMLIGDRRRHRYPVSMKDAMTIFAMCAAGIFAAGGVAFFATIVMTFFLSPLIMMANGKATAFLILSVVLSIAHIPALIIAFRREGLRRPPLLGAAVATLIAAVSAPINNLMFAPWIMPAWLLAMIAGSAAMAVRYRNGHAATGFTVGWSAAFWLTGVAAFFVNIMTRGQISDFSMSLILMSLMMLPTLASFVTLQAIWSWDDAFPKAIVRKSFDR